MSDRREWWGVEIHDNVHFFQTREAANQLVSSYGGQSRLFPVIEAPNEAEVCEAIDAGLLTCQFCPIDDYDVKSAIRHAIRKLLGENTKDAQ